MSRYLMTHSLLSSWLYCLKDNPYEDATNERDTYGEFLQVLKRAPSIPTTAMQCGIDFEALVTAITKGGGEPEHDWYEAAAKVADIISGAALQVRANKVLEVNGYTLVLHGRLDALKAGVVYDIKFTSSRNFFIGNHIDSTQHPTYMELIPEARRFDYLISNGADVWTESYRREETPSIIPVISNFLNWLEARGLMELYKEKWAAS